MGKLPIWTRAWDWLEGLPVYLAYRIIWLAARAGSPTARAVHKAMWDAYLDVPPPPGEAP